jgi:hypothetical protein
MREAHRHMDSEEAERYLMGDSPDREAAGLEEHLLICEGCRERICETDLYLSAIWGAAEELRGRPGRSGGRRGWFWGAVAGAGGLLLWLLALGYLRSFR